MTFLFFVHTQIDKKIMQICCTKYYSQHALLCGELSDKLKSYCQRNEILTIDKIDRVRDAITAIYLYTYDGELSNNYHQSIFNLQKCKWNVFGTRLQNGIRFLYNQFELLKQTDPSHFAHHDCIMEFEK